ncbi:MAG: hypothetical protein ACREJC_14100 [Tepidisphaeraceae bacterium]
MSDSLIAVGCHIQQPSQLIRRQRPPVMAPISLDAQPLQVGKRVLNGASITHHPAAELLAVL